MKYKNLNEVIRDEMELKVTCLKCRKSFRSDPMDAMSYVGTSRMYDQKLGGTADPDISLERCVDGIHCPICSASDFKVDVIKPLRSPD